jgi:septal ring factor EnvC (AmiA/AmiB activator)
MESLMRHSSHSLRVALVAGPLALAAAAVVAAQDQGVKQVEELIKKANATVSAIGETKLQLTKTLGVYNSLLSDAATDRKDLYKKLQKEMENTEKRRAEIATRKGEMDTEAQALFQSWAESAKAISDPALRKRTEDRLTKTKASYAEIATVGSKASEMYGPVMKSLGDQVTYLGHDLNPSAVASLKPNATKLNAQADELVHRIDDTMATANKNIGTLRP